MTWLLLAWVASWVVVGTITLRVIRGVPPLPPVSGDLRHEPWPEVTAIVPARNEQTGVRDALTSLLDQDYPSLKVVAVNDGSTDATGEILDSIADRKPALQVVHNPPLRDGWLGKPNAQAAGLEQAIGDWVLLTDADIQYTPGTLTRAIAYATRNDLDCLTLIPLLETDSLWEASVLPLTPIGVIVLRPDSANRPEGNGFAAGAFTMVRRSALDSLGGMSCVKQEVIDDVALGRRFKEAGFNTAALTAFDGVSVRMYHGLRSLLNGLTKNISYVIGGRRGNPIIAPLIGALFAGWTTLPVLAIAFAVWDRQPATLALALAAYLIPLLATPGLRGAARFSAAHLAFYPLGGWIVFVASVVASYYRIRRGTVMWRNREVRISS